MPTAAKLIAALVFALVAFLTAETIKPHMTEGSQFGAFSLVCAGIGLLCGWFVMGGLVGRGYAKAAGSGIRTSATLAFWGLVVFSAYEMVIRSTKMRYDGVTDALTGAFGVGAEYARVLIAPDILAVLLIGGALGGALAELGARRWL